MQNQDCSMPVIPKLRNLEIRMQCGMESKHFDKSIKQAAVINLLFIALNQFSDIDLSGHFPSVEPLGQVVYLTN